MDRGQKTAGGAIECEPTILPGRALTRVESGPARNPRRSEDSSRAVPPARMPAAALLLRQLESLCSRVRAPPRASGPSSWDVARRSIGAIVGGVGIEEALHGHPRMPSTPPESTPHVPAPEAGDVLKAPDDVIAAHSAEQKHIQGQGGGPDVAVPEDEPAEQTSVRRIGGIVEIAVAVHEEQEHVSVSQVGAGRNPFGTEFAVLVAERQMPGRMVAHEVEQPGWPARRDGHAHNAVT